MARAWAFNVLQQGVVLLSAFCGSAVEPCSPLINNVNTPEVCDGGELPSKQMRLQCLKEEASLVIAYNVDIVMCA